MESVLYFPHRTPLLFMYIQEARVSQLASSLMGSYRHPFCTHLRAYICKLASIGNILPPSALLGEIALLGDQWGHLPIACQAFHLRPPQCYLHSMGGYSHRELAPPLHYALSKLYKASQWHFLHFCEAYTALAAEQSFPLEKGGYMSLCIASHM